MESLPPRLYLEVLGDTRKSLFIVDQNYMFGKMMAPLITICNNFLRGFWILYGSIHAIQKVKTNGKALEDSIQIDWRLQGSREQIKSKCCQKSNIFKILWQQLKNQSRSYSYVTADVR